MWELKRILYMVFFKTFFKYIFCLIFILSTPAVAQQDFKAQKTAYAHIIKQEIYPYLHASVYKEGKKFLSHFNSKSNPKVDKRIIKLLKTAKEKHLSVSEDYYPLFKVFNAYYAKKIKTDRFLEFIQFTGQQLQYNRISEVKQIITNLSLFLDKQILHKSTNYTWSASQSNWEFEGEFEPLIRFSKLNLKCNHLNEKFEVKSTSGVFYLLTNRFEGTGGTVHWPNHKRKAELSNYDLFLNQIYFEAKDATLIDNTLSSKPVLGTFSHRMSILDESWKALEPQFISSEIIPIKRFRKNVRVQSGVHVKGNQIDLLAPPGKSSKIEFLKEGKPFVQLDAQRFTLDDDQFFARQSMFTLFLMDDTISHPSIDLSFDLKAQKLHAKTSNTQFGKSPFYNGLHQLQIVADHLYWEKEKNNLIFQNNQTSRLVPVQYQSLRFFDKNWFLDLFNFDLMHPTTPLLRLSRKYPGVKEFYLSEVQEAYGYTEQSDIEELMVAFTNQGFVNFNPFESKVYIQTRFFSFVTALNKDQDFDRIRFKSNVNNRPSGIIDLESGTLTVQAVNQIPVSIKNDVTLYPDDKIVYIYPNLDMEFSGKTFCGKFGFFGDHQEFNYDDYEVRFNNIDSFRYLLDIAPVEDSGIFIHPCKTVLQEFTGVLEIDHPQNKSSKQKTKSFPIIKSTAPSYVYYNKVKGGLYEKERFYFEADTFLWNSVLVLQTEELEFPGILVSGGIFPDIKETLVLNSDEELGFERDIPHNYALNNASANFAQYLKLSNSGLFGKGTVTKDDMYFEADSIDFYPDYLFASGQVFKNNSTSESSPNISGTDVLLNWFVDENWMEVSTLKSNLLVNNKTQLFGGVEYDMSNYYGFGRIIQDNVVLKSDSIELKQSQWNAFLGSMKIFPENQSEFYDNEIVLENTEIDLNYDYNIRRFINIEKNQNLKFHSPYLNYNFTYPLFTYEQGRSEIYFEPLDDEGSKSSFLNITESLNPFTGNIKYISPTSIIEMTTLEVVLVDLEGVQIADALIRPKATELKLLSSGLPEKLIDAKIDLLKPNGRINYNFSEAEVSIISGDDYLAKGNLVYNNRLGDEQKVWFDELAVNESGQTFGSSETKDETPFYIDPNMPFSGTLELDHEKDLHMILKGEIGFDDQCQNIKSESFVFLDSLTDRMTTIQNYDDKKNPMPYGSFVFQPQTNSCQVKMANQNIENNDVSLLDLVGPLQYSDSLKHYFIQLDHKTQGFIHFNPQNCEYEMEGYSMLSHHPLISSISYSRFLYSSDHPDSLVFQTHLGLDLPLPKKAIKRFRKDVAKKTKQNETTFEDSDLYRSFLNDILGEGGSQKYFKAKRRGRNYVPTSMQKTLFFTDVDFIWNVENQTFEHKIGGVELNQIDGQKIDRILDGYIRYKPGVKGDFWSIYLDLGDDEFYYFEISNDVIYTYSSSDNYIQTIHNKKKDIKKKKSTLYVQLFPYVDEIPKKMD